MPPTPLLWAGGPTADVCKVLGLQSAGCLHDPVDIPQAQGEGKVSSGITPLWQDAKPKPKPFGTIKHVQAPTTGGCRGQGLTKF